jgi:hypothetical protein
MSEAQFERLKRENENLMSVLRESESKISSHDVTIEELTMKIELSEHNIDFQQWLENVILGVKN